MRKYSQNKILRIVFSSCIQMVSFHIFKLYNSDLLLSNFIFAHEGL